MKILVVLFLSLFLVACERVNPDLDRNYAEITFYSYSSKEELNEELGISDHLGFAIWSPQDHKCEVHFIEPKFIDDNNTLTLGHEVLHCIRGSYHK